MAKTNWDAVHEKLERQGKFDEYTTPYNFDHTIKVDGNYVYINRNVFFRAFSAFIRGLLFVAGPLVTKTAFGCKVKGRENFDAVKDTGCFSVSNHVNYLDNLMLRQAIGLRKRFYITVAPHNSKSGFSGLILRSGGCLPLPSEGSVSAMRNMNGAFKELLGKKRMIHFYAEQAMWLNYPKPRPFKNGPFHFAVKYDVPILPMYVCFTPATGVRKLFGAKLKATVYVMPAVFPDKTLPAKAREEDMHIRTQRAYIEKYREVYGVSDPLIYDIAPEYYPSLKPETLLACKISAETVGQTFEPAASDKERDPV